MRSTLVALSLSLVCLGTASQSWAKKPKAAAAPKADHNVDQTLSWEQKVMGDDAGKKADMDKIAAARIAQEKAKNAPPPPPPKKDPNKEGVHAKGEASIDLAIPGDEPSAPKKTTASVKKPKPAQGSANDELGQLVAASLQEDKAPAPSASGKAPKGKARAASGPKKSDPLNAMDQMLANDR